MLWGCTLVLGWQPRQGALLPVQTGDLLLTFLYCDFVSHSLSAPKLHPQALLPGAWSSRLAGAVLLATLDSS